MTNGAVRAVVITGKYAVQSSPREKRNITPFSARMPSFVFFIFPGPRGHYANVLSTLVINTPKNVSFFQSSDTLPLSSLEGPHLCLQRLHLGIQLGKPPFDMTESVNFGAKGFVPYTRQCVVDARCVRVIKVE